uniref:Uncharacterized protein n=1 Tax=Rhodococcus sp. NS1 TaxID=402236 RepID=A0A097SQD4_9NOCA|nr:hypothetical protein LRS1606.309 [Rhodococcus sp. NS1]
MRSAVRCTPAIRTILGRPHSPSTRTGAFDRPIRLPSTDTLISHSPSSHPRPRRTCRTSDLRTAAFQPSGFSGGVAFCVAAESQGVTEEGRGLSGRENRGFITCWSSPTFGTPSPELLRFRQASTCVEPGPSSSWNDWANRQCPRSRPRVRQGLHRLAI